MKPRDNPDNAEDPLELMDVKFTQESKFKELSYIKSKFDHWGTICVSPFSQA